MITKRKFLEKVLINSFNTKIKIKSYEDKLFLILLVKISYINKIIIY